MAINKKEAIQIILNTLDEDMGIDEGNIIEKEYGWVFFPQSKRYLETKDWRDILIGSGGDLVEKETGRIIPFGSACSTEENLEVYELGYRKYDYCDLLIYEIRNKPATLNCLLELNIMYVTPEPEDEVIWKIPRFYSEKQLEKLIKILPLRLFIGCASARWKTFESLKKQTFFVYELLESQSSLISNGKLVI